MEISLPHRRVDLDLLRSIAIIFVIGYHLRWTGLQNGFIGVDIFFVLSGFLMSKMVDRARSNGNFSYLGFYRARLWRILPSLGVLIFTFWMLIFALLGIKAYDYAKVASSSILFVSNLYYYLQSGYFSPKGDLNFLLHTWSLSLEMQYYIVFPVVATFLKSLGPQKWRKGLAILTICSGSFLIMMISGQRDQSFAFYMLPSRFWEFMVGSLVWNTLGDASMAQSKCFRIKVMREMVFYMSITGLIICASGQIDLATYDWPNSRTIIVVICTGAAIAAGHGSTFAGWSFFEGLAKRSYALYLWHWPTIVLFRYFAWDEGSLSSLTILVISLALASLSYSVIESPRGHQRARWFPSPIASSVLASAVFLLSLGWSVHCRWRSPLSNFMYGYHRSNAPVQFGFDRSHMRYHQDTSEFNPLLEIPFDTSTNNYLLIGDCYAAMFSASLSKVATESRVNLIPITADDTFPTPQGPSEYPGPSAVMKSAFSQFIPQNRERIKGIILMANYSAYRKSQLQLYLEENRAFFKNLQIPITYIGQTEGFSIEGPVVAWMQEKYGINPERYTLTERRRAGEFVRSITGKTAYIDVMDRRDMNFSDGQSVLVYDTEHYSTFGTEQLKGRFEGIFTRGLAEGKK